MRIPSFHRCPESGFLWRYIKLVPENIAHPVIYEVNHSSIQTGLASFQIAKSVALYCLLILILIFWYVSSGTVHLDMWWHLIIAWIRCCLYVTLCQYCCMNAWREMRVNIWWKNKMHCDINFICYIRCWQRCVMLLRHKSRFIAFTWKHMFFMRCSASLINQIRICMLVYSYVEWSEVRSGRVSIHCSWQDGMRKQLM